MVMARFDSGGKQWCPAPNSIGILQTNTVTGVWVASGEEVEWSWAHTPQGSYVNGYVVKNKFRVAEVKAEEKGKI